MNSARDTSLRDGEHVRTAQVHHKCDIPQPIARAVLVSSRAGIEGWCIRACWVILSFAGGQVIGSLIGEGSSVRDRHRWEHEQALQRQLRELERQIWEERLPDRQREAIRERRQRETFALRAREDRW
jgi:hypothetical protein